MSHEIVPASPIHDNEFYDAVPALPSSSGHEAEADAEAVDGGIPITRSLTYHTHVAEAVDGGIPITRSLTYHTHVPGPFESERLPTQLASGIQKFLRVANLVESQEPRIAYLCRFHAFEIAHNMDRNSTGRGVRQFKYALLQRLPRDQEATLSKRKERSDIRELRRVYRAYQEYIISNGEALYLKHSEKEKLSNACRIASVLYEVLRKMTTSPNPQALDDIDSTREKSKFYVTYNILPLYSEGVEQAIMQLPEVKAAIAAVRNTRGLPSAEEFGKSQPFVDLFEFLQYCFGFQEGNVANQREHLILLLANIHIRQSHKMSSITKLGDGALDELMKKFFKNYTNWCKFMGRKNSIRLPYVQQEAQQYKLLYTGLYLLIWGEAANLRFMPECLCYIFHHMAYELHGILTGAVNVETGEKLRPAYMDGYESFLNKVVSPIYWVIDKEAKKNKGGTADHSTWRNYDDLNEFFWSSNCFQIGWPMRSDHDFFCLETMKDEVEKRKASRDAVKGKIGSETKDEEQKQPIVEKLCESKWLGKTNFVETRSFWQIFRSFDRMWSFLVMSLQALIIMACYDLGSPLEVFDSEVFEDVMSIFITSAILNLIRAMLDIAFTWKARNTMESSRRKKYVVKLVVAVIWTIVLPVCYASSRRKYTCYTKYKSSVGELCLSVYMIVVTLYLMTNAVELVLFFVPAVRKYIEVSNCRIFTALSWWTQPRLYIGRGMQETQVSQFKYTLFWILVLLSKILFSYFFEIKPLIMPTRQIMKMGVHKYEWHELFPQVKINGGAIVAIWAPIIVVYFMDTQIWYSVFCTIFGGVYGVLHHLGEIRTLGMLRSRFHSLPSAFYASLIPPVPKRDQSETRKGFYLRKSREASEAEKVGVAKFVIVWNQIVNTMRSEDYINNRELDLMKIPVSSELLSGMVRWPIFLLANKFSTAVSIAREFVGKDEILYKKIQKDKYMHCAVTECYESVKCILDNLVVGELERRVISSIVDEIEESIKRSSLLDDFNLSELPTLQAKFIELAELLVWGSESHLDKVVANESHQDKVTPNEGHHDKAIGNGSLHDKVVKNLQDIFELVTNDIMTNGSRVLDYLNSSQQADVDLPFFFRRIEPQLFESTADKSVIHFPFPDNRALHEQVKRFVLLLSIKDKALDIPANLEARRRISFFATSLFMDMPSAPKVRNMMSFSVITPHYLEDVNFSMKELRSKEDVSIIFYMLKIYPDEWKNFLERKGLENQDVEGMTLEELHALESEVKEEIRRWASFRGQTLSRSVRGMMYYREALKLQAFLDMAEDEEILEGYEAAERNNRSMFAQLDALSDMKFTYVVSCQMYGSQKASGDPHAQDILDLMIRYPSLRVAYVEEKEEIVANERPRKIYSSILVKAVNNYDQEVYRIKLPGSPNIGEGKPENQNHAIVFTRGEALQTIDTNQDNHLEEAFKMRNLLQEFFQNHGRQPPTILGLREHIFTGSVSSLAWFMSYQETSFATIGQRILANPLRVRFHYGHPDVFDRIFHITRGGISKSSKTINLSDDVFAGFNSTLRRGCITYHEYLQVGKGRDVGLNQISKFEAKVATGNSEQTLSRDIHRLARRFDFFRMLSCYFTTIGFYFSSLITVLGIYVFLYGQLYLVLSGLQRALMINTKMRNIESLETALASQSFIQLGLLTGLPMVMEIGLEKGFLTSLKDFVLMQLQLAAVFFTFSLGTKTHFYGRTLLHGGAKYKPTGRKVAVFHASFTENYRQYSRSHFVKGFELLLLLIVYDLFRRSYESNMAYILITYSIWFMSITWLFAPFLFNPSSFSWGRIVDDWKFWNKWINQQGGIGIRQDKSWQSWWNDEQDPLRCSGLAARLFEILLSLRFFMYQYGLVYHLDITQQSKNFLVYVLSWAVIVAVFIIVKAVNMGRKRFSASYHFLFRLFKALLFLCILSSIIALSIACKLSFKDLIVCCLAFLPTGWGLILIGQAVRPKIENTGLWHFTEVLAKAYDYGMGVVLFAPIAILAWLPIIHTFHTRFLFNEAFNRHLHIQPILAGRKKNK